MPAPSIARSAGADSTGLPPELGPTSSFSAALSHLPKNIAPRLPRAGPLVLFVRPLKVIRSVTLAFYKRPRRPSQSRLYPMITRRPNAISQGEATSSLGEEKPGISKLKLAIGAASLFLFLVGLKRTFRADDGSELGPSGEDLPEPQNADEPALPKRREPRLRKAPVAPSQTTPARPRRLREPR
jgi:hypothetical protein